MVKYSLRFLVFLDTMYRIGEQMELKKSDFKNIINGVKEGSIASECGIESGDILLSINSQKIEDVIEYQFLEADEYIELEIQHKNGEVVIYDIEKEYDEELGLEFSNPIIDSVRNCTNNCVFCFVDQLPQNMRETLYIKDDDSRLSFLQGNFITMTNMKDSDIEKMIRYRISPVNISVHTTNPELREKMLKNRFAKNLISNIAKLNEAGIEMNAQIVCVPGYNDKLELDRTVRDLAQFNENMHSIAVVPVGITKHRENLPKLDIFDQTSARELISQIESLQEVFLRDLGRRFVFASDEFYIIANKELPEYNEYEGFSQIENGVGLIRKFENEVITALENVNVKESHYNTSITIATGSSAYEFMKTIAQRVIDTIPGVMINVEKIVNNFFGDTITVAGLITGSDLYQQLKDSDCADVIMIPSVMLRSGEDVFLDDETLEGLEYKLNKKIVVSKVDGNDFIDKILENIVVK